MADIVLMKVVLNTSGIDSGEIDYAVPCGDQEIGIRKRNVKDVLKVLDWLKEYVVNEAEK